MSGYSFLRKIISFITIGIGPILLWYSYAYSKWYVIIIFVLIMMVTDYVLKKTSQRKGVEARKDEP